VLMDLDQFVINPSINVSPYCYSILRVDPYQTCMHRCVYCFGRWYRVESSPSSFGFDVVRGFRRVLGFLDRRGLKTIPFRLSTLVDPFQPLELEFKFSKRIMGLCLDYDVPLIINTKSTLLLDRDLFNVLMALNDRGLVVVQISLSTINGGIAKVLEPNVPSPLERFDMAEKLSREGVPVIVRLQPLIPGISDYEAEKIVEHCRNACVKQIIVEVLRDEVGNLKVYEDLAYDKSMYEDLNLWSSYSPSIEVPSKVVRPNLQWRVKVYSEIKGLCDRYGIEFSTCKEGLYNHHTAKNCCGMHYMEDGRYVLRPTLHEAWIYYVKHGRIPKLDELTVILTEQYIYGEKLKQYPRLLKKKMMSHEKILREVLDGRLRESIWHGNYSCDELIGKLRS